MTEATTNRVTTSPANGTATESDTDSPTTPPVDGVEESTATDQAEATASEPEEAWEDVAGPAAEIASDDDNPFAAPFAQAGPPEASPDGTRLAYLVTDGHGTVQLWLSPTDGGEAVAIDLPFTPIDDVDPDTGRVLRGPQWSPDGQTLALTGTHPEASAHDRRTSIWLVPVPPLAQAVTPDTATGSVADNAQATAVPVDADAPAETDAADDAGTSDNEIQTDVAADATAEPAAAVVETPPSEPQDAGEVPAPALVTEPTPLSDHPTASDRTPRWSPDGMLIAFVRRLDGHDAIALASADGAMPVAAELLTWAGANDREPSWSRDGLFLAFTRQLPDGPEHADIVVFILATGEIRNLTGEKTPAIRHSLDWVPGRNLVAYVTRENDWLSIAVINSDNKAGWTVTREAGDKTDPRFGPKEARLVYVRSEGFTTVCCERGLHASGAVAIDPGEGVAVYPRWVAEKTVAFGFSAPQRPFGFIVQENVATGDRTAIAVPGISPTSAQTFRQPQPFEFSVGPEEQFSGLLYRTGGVAGNVPGIVYLPDGPLHTRRGGCQPEEQALANTAMAVLTPVIHGATGFGAAVEDDLAELADTELEISDVAEAGAALGAVSDIDGTKLAVVGHGFGGTLALLTAGARPGVYAAVAAIDPITDWSIELEHASVPWRNWVSRQYGMPLTERDRYALRTPETFAGVIDVPLILVSTERSMSRELQMQAFTAYLDEVGVTYELVEAREESIPAILQTVGRKLANQFLEGRDSVQVVDDLRADET